MRTLLSEFLLVSVGKIVSLGALFACSIVVAQFGGANELGRFAAALFIVTQLDVALGGSLDYAAVRFSALHRNEASRVVRFHGATFRIKAALVAVMILITLVGLRPIAGALFDAGEHPTLLLWCTGAAASLILLRSTFAWLQSTVRFKTYAALDALNGVLRIGAMIGVGLLGMRSAEAFLGVFAGAVLGTYLGSLVFIPQPYILAPRPSRQDVGAILSYLGPTAVILILGTFTGRSDVFFVKRLDSAEAAGLYAAAAQIASIITMFASYACLVLQPRLLHAGTASVRRLALLSVGVGFASALVLLPGVHFLGPWGLDLVFGQEFRPAAAVLSVLMIGTCLDLIFMPVLMTYAMQARAHASMAGEIAITVAYIGLMSYVGDRGMLMIAFVATATRGLKLVLYTFLALTASPTATVALTASPADP